MSSTNGDNHGIEAYFTASEFAEFSEYEKLRLRNMKQNYEMMIKVGKCYMYLANDRFLAFKFHEWIYLGYK